ncbi:MAG: phosphoenolpyruvate synthase, partial [Caldilinea sp.]|nr:phosphoenolpyruvate synthase [Caldilinea sp.]
KNVNVSAEDRSRFSVSEADVLTLADWAMAIEEHYTARRGVDMPMDIEWAKDGRSGELFIVQARPETVHSQRTVTQIQSYRLEEKGEVLVKGLAVGDKIASGTVNVIPNVSHIRDFKAGQ